MIPLDIENTSIGLKFESIIGSYVSTQGKGLLDSLMKDLKHYKVISGGVHTTIELDKYFGKKFEEDTK